MPAYNEEAGVADTVRAFKELPEVDEVIVADNNSRDRTVELARTAGAIIVPEPKQGYGHACIRALTSATGDYVVLVESDSSFIARDVYKFLAFIEEFDMVKGGRSNKHMIGPDADWGPFLKYGNWFIAKLIQLLYNGPSMREAGGTFRIVRAPLLRTILPHLTRTDSAFLPDMVTIALRKGARILELPVNYRKRKGVSKITGNRWRAFKLGFSMIKVVLWNRVKSLRS
jgi:glycosyltransferase involved in cell wall biosynthesis